MNFVRKQLLLLVAFALLLGCSPRSPETSLPATVANKFVGKWAGPKGVDLYFDQQGHATCTIEGEADIGIVAEYWTGSNSPDVINIKIPIKVPTRIPKRFPPPPPFHTNAVVAMHRATIPDDVRTDDQLTLLYGASPNAATLAQKYPDFAADCERLSGEEKEALAEAQEDPAIKMVRGFLGVESLTNNLFTIRVSFPTQDEMILNPQDGQYSSLGFVFKRSK